MLNMRDGDAFRSSWMGLPILRVCKKEVVVTMKCHNKVEGCDGNHSLCSKCLKELVKKTEESFIEVGKNEKG